MPALRLSCSGFLLTTSFHILKSYLLRRFVIANVANLEAGIKSTFILTYVKEKQFFSIQVGEEGSVLCAVVQVWLEALA